MSRLRVLSAVALLLCAQQALAKESAAKTVHDCIQGYVGFFGETGRDDAEKRAMEDAREEMHRGCFTQSFSAQLKKGGGEDGFLHARKGLESWIEHIDLRGLDLTRGHVVAVLGLGANTHCLELGLKRVAAVWRIDSSRLCAAR